MLTGAKIKINIHNDNNKDSNSPTVMQFGRKIGVKYFNGKIPLKQFF